MSESGCTQCAKVVLATTLARTGGLCMPCAKQRARAAKKLTLPQLELGPDPLDPVMAHPVARSLMTDAWMWSIGDEASPLGSDTGADTLADFRDWRKDHPNGNPIHFLNALLRGWGVREMEWDLVEPLALAALLRRRHFEVLTRDDAVIALAFAQLVDEGTVCATVRERALWALQRQAAPNVIAFRGWVDPNERAARVRRMMEVLEDGRITMQ